MEQKQLISTARMAGVWYLMLAITGVLGFMVFHPQIFISNDPHKTLINLIDLESTARIRLLLEAFIIIAQALAAVWFYKLFREIDSWAAWTLGIWGMMNCAAIMVSAMSMSVAIDIAISSTQTFDEKIPLIHLLSIMISNAWGVGNIFFGLWLLPMGYIVIRSKRMPQWLGWTLIAGCVGYLLNVFTGFMGWKHPALNFLVIPATIGEFWMVGYLLIFGIRPIANEL